MTAAKTTVHEAMAKVMADVGAIGKNRKADAKMGGYSFRGIDDLYNAMHGPLAKHGVFYVPEVLDEQEQTYKTSGGATMRLVRVKVRYRFYGPAGDCVEAVTIGEAADTGDKAANKAMTAALKYLLFQVFCIAVEGDEDADAQSPTFTEPTQQPPAARSSVPDVPPLSEEQMNDISKLLSDLTMLGESKGDVEELEKQALKWGKVKRWEQLTCDQADVLIDRLAKKVAVKRAEQAQAELDAGAAA